MIYICCLLFAGKILIWNWIKKNFNKYIIGIHIVFHICRYLMVLLYGYSYVVSCAIIVEYDSNVPFTIATTLRCKGGCYSFPWVPSHTFDAYFIMLSVKQGGTKCHFFPFFLCVFGMTKPGIEPWSPEPLANMLTIIPIGQNGNIN